MATLLENIEYLSKEIGARPAGTEEEQQAALYIAEEFQKESSFPTNIEEFTSSSNMEGVGAILAVVTLVVTILAMLFSVLTIPAFLLAAIAAAVYTLESLDKPILSKALAHGASQNVVAKYQPFSQDSSGSKSGRSRKIVLVAHYDTGKVVPPLVQRAQSSGLPLGYICMGGMCAAALLLLIRIFVGTPEGVGGIVLIVLTILALILVLLPIIKAVLMHLAPYNEGANNNASGVAALIEVARRINRGSVSEADLAASASNVTIHGEEAAIESGLVPEGAQIRYEAEQLKPPEEIGAYDEEERLLSAKAAIAALTGKPVERKVYGSVADHLVNSRAHALPEDEAPVEQLDTEAAEEQVEGEPMAEKSVETQKTAAFEVAQPAKKEEPEEPAVATGFENAPSWFISAQQNAKRSTGESQVQRSRYTEAIEVAEREAAERERVRAEAERQKAEDERRAREEAARASIEAAHIGMRPTQAEEEAPEQRDEGLEQSVPAIVSVPDIKVDAADQQAALDPGSTVAHAPLSMEELRKEMESDQEEESSIIAPPEEFSMPTHRFELPKIESGSSVPENTNPSRSGLFRMLRTDVPSLSGIIRMQEAGEDVSQKPEPKPEPTPVLPSFESPEFDNAVDYNMELPLNDTLTNQATDEPAQDAAWQVEPIGAHEGEVARDGAQAPETDAFEPASAPAEPEAHDEHDQRVEEEPAVEERPRSSTRSSRSSRSSSRRRGSTVADAGEVEMPSSRSGGFFSHFRRKEEKLEETPQKWLDIDDDFDARTVGKKRGGWESFRDDQYDDDFDQYDDFDFGDEKESRGGRRWNGGTFSRVELGHVDMRSGEDSDADEQEGLVETFEDHSLTGEIERIYHFRNPLFNTEVWFVAIGSDTELHDGARAFYEEHRDELRGSMIVEVESLGVGELAVASEEGRFHKIKASSRVKRYMRQATNATGISPSSVALSGSDSITTTLQKAGCQTMHLLGIEDGQPALKGSADDVFENIDELTLEENVNFLYELLKRG